MHEAPVLHASYTKNTYLSQHQNVSCAQQRSRSSHSFKQSTSLPCVVVHVHNVHHNSNNNKQKTAIASEGLALPLDSTHAGIGRPTYSLETQRTHRLATDQAWPRCTPHTLKKYTEIPHSVTAWGLSPGARTTLTHSPGAPSLSPC